MKIVDLIHGMNKPKINLAHLVYLERYVNDAKGDFSIYSEVNPRYSPEQGEKYFQLPFKVIEQSEILDLSYDPDKKLLDEIRTNTGFKFFWHPDSKPQSISLNPDGYIKVSPSSSTRTLISLEQANNFMIKTDLDKRHFRFRRRLKSSSVRHSIEINRELKSLIKESKIPFYAILPESIGLIPKNTIDTGVIFRELTPFPMVNDSRQIIPYFSLYSNDSFMIGDKPILIQLIELNNFYNPLDFFVEVIIGLIQDTWVYLVKERGILPELHGQNALLEIDESGKPTRLIHRDFQSTYSDSKIRSEKNLVLFAKHIVGHEDGISEKEQYSLIFDHFISTYLIARMVKVFSEHFVKYKKEDIENEIRKRFIRVGNDTLNLFPETTFRFSKIKSVDNTVTLINTGFKPIFR